MIVTSGVAGMMFTAAQYGSAYVGKDTMSFASAVVAQVGTARSSSRSMAAALAKPARRGMAIARLALGYIFWEENVSVLRKVKRSSIEAGLSPSEQKRMYDWLVY